ncbi:DUF6477 family protein [Pseudophaeobacter arcticus]|jgi:hypothetical protein|uniref:DUF6477 family protein n=1 Tax=Pseudophaeobacter arcticus TaxID=385492 RepID=UPI0039E3E035
MQDLLSRLKTLHRPRLLVRTARIGAGNYSRERDLRRILGTEKPARPAAAIMRLLDLEHEVNQQRLSGDAGYAISRHVEILIALLGEAEYLAPPAQQDRPAAAEANNTSPLPN